MGACDFMITCKAATAKAAFDEAREDARHEHGHGGYTGTIAEKSSFRMISTPAGVTPREHARNLLAADTRHFTQDSFGPAGCIKIAEGEWLFFGFASS